MAGKLKFDLTGQKFGRWTVLERTESLNNHDTTWLCRCDCGTERRVLAKNLRNGRSTSCGCYKNKVSGQLMAERNRAGALDLRGQKYGKLTPIQPTEKRCSGSIVWECLCDCGRTTYVSVDNLRGLHPIRSCGCIGASVGEYQIQQILEENNIHFSAEYHPEDGYGRYDFAILENNEVVRFIEFDGEQHYGNSTNWGNSTEKLQVRDKIKNEYALSHNIPLIRIPYWMRDKITLDMLLGDEYLVKQ